MSTKTYVIMRLVSVYALIMAVASTSGYGEGEKTTPIPIDSIENLQKIGNDPAYPKNGYYVLTRDIDARVTAGWNGGAGFDPIAVSASFPFSGTFDGQGYTITGLRIFRPSRSSVGLFAHTSGTIQNVGMVGGSVTGYNNVGCLVGRNTGLIISCYATGSVSGSENIGCLSGANSGSITSCYGTGAVSGDYAYCSAGGLVGVNDGNITSCYATGAVSSEHSYVGGLAGYNYYDGIISLCYSMGTVSGADVIGGLVGQNVGRITLSYATGEVSGGESIGGFVGRSQSGGTITSCYASGEVSGSRYVGGLVGNNQSIIKSCYATGTVSGNDDIGGMVGVNLWDGTITSCYAIGTVSGNNNVGGLLGRKGNHNGITLSYATGTVSGDRHIGGLVGEAKDGTITLCYATGTTKGYQSVGGLVGYTGDDISESYATGAVIGDLSVGGLVGETAERGSITLCYSVGPVTGDIKVGGLVGYNYNNRITMCYWDLDTSGQSNSDGGKGLTTDEMTYPYGDSIYAEWDFVVVWATDMDSSVNSGYPFLRLNPPPVSLSVVPSNRDVGAEACETTFDITTTAEWTTTSSVAWASLNSASGTGDTKLTVMCEANLGMTRSAIVTVTGIGTHPLWVAVALNQEAAPTDGDSEGDAEEDTEGDAEGDAEGDTEGDDNYKMSCDCSDGKSLRDCLGDWLLVGLLLMALAGFRNR